MDFQDSRSNSLSGHENHICHKCGWPFPNPHPSARHRRAHKKICGTIEGYNKFTDSEEHNPFTVSDDEHNSDDDRQTPSPKFEKRIITEMSCRSEDDVFSDAVTEFLDSTGTEEGESGRNIAKSLEAELDASQLLKVDATNDITKALNSPTGSTEVYNPEVTESATTTLQETRSEEFGIALSSINGLPRDMSKSEIPMDTPKNNINANVGDNGKQELATCLGQETGVKGNEEEDVGKILKDVEAPLSKTTTEASDAELKSQETDEKALDPVTMDAILGSKQEQSDGLGLEMVKHDVPPEVESVQIKLESAQDIKGVGTHGDPVEFCDAKGEEKEDLHVLSVANDLIANVGDNGKQELTTSLGQETGVEGNEEEGVGKILKDVEAPLSKTTTKASEVELKSQETDGKASDPVTMDAIIGSKQEQSDGLVLEMVEHDVPRVVESVQIKSESAQEDIKGVGTHDDPVEFCDAKGKEKEDLHVLSVANDLNANVGDNGKQELTTCLGQETGVKGNEEEDVGKILKDVEAPLSKTTTEASEAELKSQETDGKALDPVTMDAIIVSKQEQSDGLGLETVEHDVPPEVESVQIKAESAQEDIKGVGPHGDPVEFWDAKEEEKEDLHVLSVANDLPVVDQPEIMLEDFKDHKALKSNLSLTLVGSAEVIKPAEIDNEDVVHEEESLSSSDLADKLGAQSIQGSADMNAMEGEENKLIIEVPFEGEAETSEFKVTSSEDLRSNGLEASPDTSRIETEKIQIHRHLQGSQPQSFENESPRAVCTTIDLLDVIPIVTSVNRTNNLGEGENADDREMDKFVAAENESREEGVLEQLPATVEEDVADSSSVSKVSQTRNLPGRDVTREHEDARIELPDIARTESTEGATVEENFPANTKPELEYVGHFSELTYLGSVPDSTEVEFDTSDLTSMTQTDSGFPKRPDEDSLEVIKEPESSKDSDVVAECVGAAVRMGSESNHITDAGVSEKVSETSILKEQKPLHIDSGFTPHSTDAQVSEKNLEKPILEEPGSFPLDSGVSSEPKQEEGDEKLPKQHFGVSAADISVDSSSQTDSLECNWGSVSVLSIQSDAPTYVGAEAGLPSTDDSQAAAAAPSRKSEKGNLEKPKSAASDKSEVFEPPSFMTLVKPADQKGGVDSEIETVPQPNSEALQAGWFPSLSNVVIESPGRKKNEEIIAKVTNWSTGKQHSPLKTLLSEANAETKAKSPNPKHTQKDESGAKNTGSVATTVMGSEVVADEIGKRERGKEDLYPTHNNNKKDKRKMKGKPSWAPFVCCSSIN